MSEERDLPEGWAWARLADLASKQRNAFTIGPFGSSLKVSDYRDAGVPLVFVRDIRAERFGGPNTKYVSPRKAEELAAHVVRPGDLLVTKMGEPPGDTAIYPAGRPAAIITADCIKLSPEESLTSSAFLRLGIRSPLVQEQIVEQTMGVAQQKLSLARFKEVRTPFPPLPEQHRIVEKVEALLEQVNRAKDRLDRVPLILKRFQQAVLAAAYSGELTKEWRDAGDDPVEANAELADLPPLVQRRQPVTVSHPVELRATWTSRPLGSVAEVIDPNPSHRYPEQGNGTVPLLATREFDGLGDWNLAGAPLVPQSVWQEQNQTCRFSPDDIIFARKGRLGLARRPPPVQRYTFSHTIFVLKTRVPVSSAYLLWFLRQQAVVDDLLHEMNSNEGVPTLGKAFLERVSVPLPPTKEQAEIVRRVEGLFTLADAIEVRVKVALQRSEKLPQAILSKAFSGELVPTEAELARLEGRSFETAEELLKRVTQSGSNGGSAPTRGRRARKAG